MEDGHGRSSHLEKESKVDWLGFLVWYAECVAISQAKLYHHAVRHPVFRSHRASPPQSCTNCVMKASVCQHFLRRDAGSCLTRNPHGDTAPATLVIHQVKTSWQSNILLYLNCPDTLVPLFDGRLYDFASGI